MRARWEHGAGLKLGVVQNVPDWAKYVALALGVPLAVAYWLGCSSGSPAHPNDFDRFLVCEPGHPTGLPASASEDGTRKKKKKKQSGSGWWSWACGSGGAVSPQDRGKVSGPFETFLRVEEPGAEGSDDEEDDDHRDPLDFNSFLKAAIPSSSASAPRAVNSQQQLAPAAPQGPRPDQARVLVMFGTEFGFSKEIAEKLCDKLRAADKYWPVLEDMAEHPGGYDFGREQALFIACSTQGDGVPPTEPRDFCEWLMAGKAGPLPHLSFSVCALGDKSYQHFCRCGKLLDAALASAGAKCVAPRQDVNKEDWDAVNAWMDAAVAGLGHLDLQPVGEAAAAALGGGAAAHAEPKAKRWGKSRPYPARVVAVEPLCRVTNKHDKVTVRVELDVGTASGLGNYTPGDALGLFAPNDTEAVDELLRVVGVDGSLPVPVPSWHFAEDADEEGEAGCPQGPTMQVREAMRKCYDLRVPKAELFHALWAALPEGARTKAQGAAAQHREVSEEQASGGDEEVQAALLARLLAGGSGALDAYFDYTGRHVVDVLRTFPSARISISQLLGALRALQPRLYSISSSPLECDGRVQATIAEVRYEAFGKPRAGVASAHVSSCLQPGDRVRAYIHKNPDFRLPADPATPIIMVGPGTGLAPFRAFILHRLLGSTGSDADSVGVGSSAGSSVGSTVLSGSDASGAVHGAALHTDADGQQHTPAGNGGIKQKEVGQMVLFFGCRRRDQDYLYGKDLDAWAASGAITLFNAFSREQDTKVYVQDRLRAEADLVWKLIDEQGAHFYVCGDASSMAGAVEKELLAIFAAHLSAHAPGGPEASGANAYTSKKAAKKRAAAAGAEDVAAAAQAYLEGLAASGRYQRDVWYA